MTFSDTFRFVFPNAVAGSTLTMRTLQRLHGTNVQNLDPSLFYDGNSASSITEFSVVGLGIAPGHQFFSSAYVGNGAVQTLGSADDNQVYERTLTLNASRSFSSFVTMQLKTNIQFVNGFLGSVGVGSGMIGADFSSTAGVVSIGFFDSLNQPVEYTLTTDTGAFAFLPAVPEPATRSIMLLGLCAIAGAGIAQRRTRPRAAAAV